MKRLEILVKYGLCSGVKWESQKIKEIGNISLEKKERLREGVGVRYKLEIFFVKKSTVIEKVDSESLRV